MASFQFNGRTDKELVSLVSKTLDESEIPSVLWGDLLLDIYGVPNGFADCRRGIYGAPDGYAEISFVIPDYLMDKACQVLEEASFTPCTQGERCPIVDPWRIRPMPHTHFHIREGNGREPALTLDLHLKTHLMWALPDFFFNMSPFYYDYMVASDHRLPNPFPESLYPVKVPNVTNYAEMLVRLYCRDSDYTVTNRGQYWMLLQWKLLTYCAGSVGFLDLDQLMPPLAIYYTMLSIESTHETWTYARRLAKQLEDGRILPPPPPPLIPGAPPS